MFYILFWLYFTIFIYRKKVKFLIIWVPISFDFSKKFDFMEIYVIIYILSSLIRKINTNLFA